MTKKITISPALRDLIMREITQQLDNALDAEEYEFSVMLYIELHHADLNISVGGRPREEDVDA